MATQVQSKASERVVVLLRPKEKQKLVRLARRENVSAAEILRRSLNSYLETAPNAEAEFYLQVGATLDKMHESLQAANKKIDERLRASERLQHSPEHEARMAQLDAFIAQHARASRKDNKQRSKVA